MHDRILASPPREIMNIFFGIVFLLIAAALCISVFRNESALRKFFLAALAWKVIAGVGVGIVYVFYYKSGDTIAFFSDGVSLANIAYKDLASYFNFLWSSSFLNNVSAQLSFGDQRAVYMVKIVSLFTLVSFQNYWLVSIYVSLVSFFGAWYLVKQIHKNFPSATAPAMVALLFFPSVVFWTSGLIKETLAMAGLYFICGVFIRFWFRKKISVAEILATVLSAYLLWKLKYYFAGIFFAILGATILYQLFSVIVKTEWRGVRGYLVWLAILFALIAGVSLLHPNFRHDRLLQVMVNNYNAFQEFSRPGTTIIFEDIEPSLRSLLRHSPEALFAGLFRPLFFDAGNFFGWYISCENLVLLMLFALSLKHIPKIFSSNVSILLCAIVVYVILLAIFITLSTPNLGTLARYRVGYLPFFVFLILLVPATAIRLQRILRIPAIDQRG